MGYKSPPLDNQTPPQGSSFWEDKACSKIFTNNGNETRHCNANDPKINKYLFQSPEGILSTVSAELFGWQDVHHTLLDALANKGVEPPPLLRGGIKERVQQDAMEGDILEEYCHTWKARTLLRYTERTTNYL